MNESPSPTPLTDQALARLRKLAADNGVAAEKIELFGTEEQTYTLKGTLTLTPKCTVETGRYPGPAKGGKGRKVFPSLAAMHEEVQQQKKQFESGRGWIDASLKELKAAPGEGWGLEGAQITMPEQTTVFTASTTCPQCRGQKLVTCAQCQGQGMVLCPVCRGNRQEVCYACGGTGNNPQNPTLRCGVCGGTRFTACRQCGGRGQTTCPTCHGRRGTPCPGCNGTGQVSEEIAVIGTVDTNFKLNPSGLPSGLRNGLGRLGIPNLAKGHADIKIIPLTAEEQEAANNQSSNTDSDEERKPVTHSINYEATMPYADVRMNFNGSKAHVGVFGKRGVLLNVPPFLDNALKPAREKLAQAARGAGDIDNTLPMGVIKSALQLELAGNGNDWRRLYPVGLSQEVMREILGNLRLVLKRQTLKIRIIIATLCAAISGGVFAGIFMTSLHANLTTGWPLWMQAAFDLALLVLPMGLSWLALNFATRASLQQHFKDHTISLQQTIGKTSYAMFAAIFVLYGAILLLAPLKPGWLLVLYMKG